MAQAEQPAEPTGVEDQRPPDMEQRATWLELFFDLVVVVAVARSPSARTSTPVWPGSGSPW
jgi:low temperature requirement protein LtrA